MNDSEAKQNGNPSATSIIAKSVENPPAIAEKLTLRQLISRYGSFILVSYTGVWLTTGIGCYAAVSALGPEFAIEGFRSLGLEKYVDLSRMDPKLGNVAVAIVANELLEPVRLPIYLACIRPATRRYDAWLRSRGKVPGEPNPNSLAGKLRAFGPFGVAYYTSVWAGTGVASFLAISAFGPDFAISGANAIGIGEYVDLTRLDPTLGNAAIAFVMNEMLEPIRFPFVLASLGPAHKIYDAKIKPKLLALVQRGTK